MNKHENNKEKEQSTNPIEINREIKKMIIQQQFSKIILQLLKKLKEVEVKMI